MEGDPKLKPRFSGKKPQFQPLSQASVLPSAPWSPHSQTSLSTRQMAVSYVTATTTAVATAVGMNMLTKVRFGAAMDMVVTRGQQNPRENFFSQVWVVSQTEELGSRQSLAK